MENYDRQQYGGDSGEVREDAFVGPSDGQEAVPEDAGQGDYWGGSPRSKVLIHSVSMLSLKTRVVS